MYLERRDLGGELRLDEDHQSVGQHAVICIASAIGSVCIAAMTTSMPAMSIRTATRVGFSGSTNVRSDAGGSEDLFALRRGKPMLGVLHVVVGDHGGHGVLLCPTNGNLGHDVRPGQTTVG
jgi:hypothetical protein